MENKYLDFPLEVKAEDVGDGGTFTGYASTFDGPPDAYGDVVKQGAFLGSISKGGRNGNGIALLYQHDSKQPVGIWESMVENKTGLKVQGRLALDTRLGKDAHSLLRMGAIKGLSIGFDLKNYEIDKKRKIRYIKEVDLWEVSLVTFPANTRARVTAVKMIEEAQTPREMEDALREVGLSRNAAKYLVSKLRHNLREADEGRNRGGEDQILSALKQLNAKRYVDRQLRGGF